MESNQNLFDLQVDHQSSVFLRETAKWSKFLAIVGFVVCALLVILGLFFSSVMATMGSMAGMGDMFAGASVVISVMYVLIALIYFLPCLYLYRFATKMQVALNTNDQVQLNASFGNLKSCFKFMGVLTLVILCLYALFFILGIIGAAFMS
ncbi:MAG TPA: DUF5362 family protein [Parasegetibacter sp.]|jgi:hypothetical protein